MSKTKIIGKYSYALIHRPSFLEGMASLFDFRQGKIKYALGRSATRIENTKRNTDSKALSSDWCAVGEDIKSAIKNYTNAR